MIERTVKYWFLLILSRKEGHSNLSLRYYEKDGEKINSKVRGKKRIAINPMHQVDDTYSTRSRKYILSHNADKPEKKKKQFQTRIVK